MTKKEISDFNDIIRDIFLHHNINEGVTFNTNEPKAIRYTYPESDITAEVVEVKFLDKKIEVGFLMDSTDGFSCLSAIGSANNEHKAALIAVHEFAGGVMCEYCTVGL